MSDARCSAVVPFAAPPQAVAPAARVGTAAWPLLDPAGPVALI